MNKYYVNIINENTRDNVVVLFTLYNSYCILTPKTEPKIIVERSYAIVSDEYKENIRINIYKIISIILYSTKKAATGLFFSFSDVY